MQLVTADLAPRLAGALANGFEEERAVANPDRQLARGTGSRVSALLKRSKMTHADRWTDCVEAVPPLCTKMPIRSSMANRGVLEFGTEEGRYKRRPRSRRIPESIMLRAS